MLVKYCCFRPSPKFCQPLSTLHFCQITGLAALTKPSDRVSWAPVYGKQHTYAPSLFGSTVKHKGCCSYIDQVTSLVALLACNCNSFRNFL